ncbi:MAG: magnesium transporter CorA [Mycobacterium sp.]|nr:magnesium transporter CorA [Mycobacterium sp.]
MPSEQEWRDARLRKSLTWVALGAVDLVKKPRKKASAPGAVESGDHIVDCALYVDGVRREGKLPLGGALSAAQQSGGFVWIGLHEPSTQELSGLAEEFGLHPLAVEDAVNAHQRPKVDRYDKELFVVLKTTRYVEHRDLTWNSEVVETGEIMLFLGENFVVSVRHGRVGSLTKVRARLEAQPELLRLGPAAVVYAVADAVVDGHLHVADEVEDDVDEIEQQVFAPRVGRDVAGVYQFKREVLEFRRAVVPLVGPLAELREAPEMAALTAELRDVEDHLQRVADQVAGFDELLNALLDSQLARVAVQQNDDMRKISAWVAIAAVPTALAGIYGMNFDHMPELRWTFGYPLVLLVMLTVCTGLYRAFRKSGWL